MDVTVELLQERLALLLRQHAERVEQAVRIDGAIRFLAALIAEVQAAPAAPATPPTEAHDATT